MNKSHEEVNAMKEDEDRHRAEIKEVKMEIANLRRMG